jgi:hypothetical protein
MRAIALLLVYASCEFCLGSPGTNGVPAATPTSATKLVPLLFRYPAPSWGVNGIYEKPSGPHIEPLTDKERAPLLVPVGVTNLALKKRVTASVANPVSGTLSMVTDGQKEATETNVVALPKGVQWVELDLERECRIYAVVIWHDFYYHRPVFRGVVVQASDDASFSQHVRTLFNNDFENTAGFGKGADKQYFEGYEGKLIDTNGIEARYLRFYSNGSNNSPLNGYIDIEVWGFLAESQAERTSPTNGSSR